MAEADGRTPFTFIWYAELTSSTRQSIAKNLGRSTFKLSVAKEAHATECCRMSRSH